VRRHRVARRAHPRYRSRDAVQQDQEVLADADAELNSVFISAPERTAHPAVTPTVAFLISPPNSSSPARSTGLLSEFTSISNRNDPPVAFLNSRRPAR
jgi:hypothetical protein